MSFDEYKFEDDNGQAEYVNWRDQDPGSTWTGEYKRTVTKDCVSKDGRRFKSTTHYLNTGDGTIGLNGTGLLNYKFAELEPGDVVRVKYIGLGDYNGTESYQFSVAKGTKSSDSESF